MKIINLVKCTAFRTYYNKHGERHAYLKVNTKRALVADIT